MASFVRHLPWIGIWMACCFAVPFGFLTGDGLVWIRTRGLPVRVGPHADPWNAMAITLVLALICALLALQKSWPRAARIAAAGVLTGLLSLLVLLGRGGELAGSLNASLVVAVAAIGLTLTQVVIEQSTSRHRVVLLGAAMAGLGALLASPAALRAIGASPEIRILRATEQFARGKKWKGYELGVVEDSGIACSRVYFPDGSIRDCQLSWRGGSVSVSSCSPRSAGAECLGAWRDAVATRE